MRHGLEAPDFFDADRLVDVRSQRMTGSDLADDVDLALSVHVLSAEGRAFTGACYERYLHEYDRVFEDLLPYSIVEDDSTYDQMSPILDQLYTEWVAAWRPDGGPEDSDRPMADPEAADHRFEADLLAVTPGSVSVWSADAR